MIAFRSKHKKSDQMSSLANLLVGNSIPSIAMAKVFGWSVVDLIYWIVEQYYSKGYHNVWLNRYGKANIDAYVEFFVQSRRYVTECESNVQRYNTQIQIISRLLYLKNPPEALFFFDVELEELCTYLSMLVIRHAKLLGIEINIFYDRYSEIATIKIPAKAPKL